MARNKGKKGLPFIPLNEARSMSIKELEKEYARYRKTFSERIRRLSKGTEAQQRVAKPFQVGGYKNPSTITEIKKYAKSQLQYKTILEKRLTELSQLANKPSLSLEGWQAQEKQTLKTLQEVGYTNIKTRKQLEDFGKFMGQMRYLFGNKQFPSEEVAELFDLSLDKENAILARQELLEILEDLGADADELGVDIFS